MANNDKQTNAKKEKFSEFYTQYEDIQKEVNSYIEYNPDVFKDKTILLPCDDPEWSNFTKFFAQNFERFGLKKLISTSYSFESKNLNVPYQLSLFEKASPLYDEKKTKTHGKIFILDKDENKSGKIDIDDLKWNYLDGDGDFRSNEVKKLRDEADVIITNPPFSLFREFFSWIIDAKKEFLIIGNINAITYKEIFPLIKDNKVWLGPSITSGDRKFLIPNELFDHSKVKGKVESDSKGNKYVHVVGVRWFTNLDHGRRHQPLQLMTMNDNIEFSKHKEINGKSYDKYLNMDVLEVPYADSIPSDYTGYMCVPVSFMDKYNPDQFEIIGNAEADVLPKEWKGMTQSFVDLYYKQGNTGSIKAGNRLAHYISSDGLAVVPYKRIIIKPIMGFSKEDK